MATTAYISKGEIFPLCCPECSELIPYRDDEPVTCAQCGHCDCLEAFSAVEYKLLPIQ